MLKKLFLISLLFTTNAFAQERVLDVPFNGNYFDVGRNDRPGILLITGSGMGKDHERAKLLANMGYNVLALAYYGEEDLPETLELIPLEYFDRARQWLVNRNEGVILFGLSKGAELSLLVASQDQKYDAVIALAPSKVVWQGFPKDFSKIMKSPSSWSINGKGVPFVPYISREKQKELGIDNRHQASLTNDTAVNNALIKVENINVPTLLLSGGKDQSWPSAEMAWDICERMTEKYCSHISYPNGGHLLEKYQDQYFTEVEKFLKMLP